MKTALILIASAATVVAGSAHAASILEQPSPTPTLYIFGVDYGTSAFGPAVIDVTAPIFRLTGTTGVHGLSLGCSSSDYGVGTAGSIVLLSRGGCQFDAKAILAQQAGALSILIADNDPTNTVLGIGGFAPSLTITAFRLSFGLGEQLAAQTLTTPATMRVALGDRLVSNLPAVPEPATWMMMVSGLGAIGIAARRTGRSRSGPSPA